MRSSDANMQLTLPVSISKRRIPTLHQSATLSCPRPRIISGAMYTRVPHIEFDLVFSQNSFARPKSVSMAYKCRAKEEMSAN